MEQPLEHSHNNLEQPQEHSTVGLSTTYLLAQTVSIFSNLLFGTLRACIRLVKLHFSFYILLIKLWIPFVALKICLLIVRAFKTVLELPRVI